MNILTTKSIYYNDVNLLPRVGCRLASRKNIWRETHRIIVAPMSALIGQKFVIAAAKAGLSVCLARKFYIKEQLEMYRDFYDNVVSDRQLCFTSIGVRQGLEQNRRFLEKNKINYGIDIANGYLELAGFGMPKKLTSVEHFYIGNVNTQEGFNHVLKYSRGLNTYVRVGIAGGMGCATNDMVGVNRGAITEIDEIYKYRRNNAIKKAFIIADGGIKNPSYANKAFAAGADYVMMGGYFSNAEEAQTNIDGDGTYWGNASEKELSACNIKNTHSEGKVLKIKKDLVPLQKLVDDLWGGISSYVTYSGYDRLSEAIGNGIFEIKENSLDPRLNTLLK